MVVTNVLDPRSRYSVLDDGTLMIANADMDDRGVYECMARNIVGEKKTRPVNLKYRDFAVEKEEIETTSVSPKEEIFREDRTVVLEAGETLALECSVADGLNEVIWTKDGSILNEEARIILTPSGGLMVKNLLEDDNGAYLCISTGEEGSIQSEITTLLVQSENQVILISYSIN